MKSLKRTLCLVLAMVMVLGFFGIASAESFKDDDTIQYKEAVGVMTGIGSINGMGDNTFAPTGKVTRAQAAKMVAYAVLGADVAKTLPASTSRFKDVDSNFAWAIPSIEYLANAGVINGRGNGTFDPNGEVTGYEIAKMLLCAAGYGKNGEFTGDSWALNVAIAEKNHVFAGTKAADRNAAATREECALYCFNGITMVGQVTYNKTNETYSLPGDTIAKEVYNLQASSGVVTANSSNTANSTTTTLRSTVGSYASTTFNINTDVTQLGDYITIYYNDEDKNSAYDAGETIYNFVDESIVLGVSSTIDSAAKWKATFGTETANTLATETNLFSDAMVASTGGIGGFAVNTDAPIGIYVLNGNEIVSYFAPTTYVMDKVSNIVTTSGSEAIVLAGAGSLANNSNSDVVNEYEGVAKGDVVFYSVGGSGASSVYTLYTPATVTGKVTKVVDNSGTYTYTIDGKNYTGVAAVGSSGLINKAPDFASTYTLYLAPNGMWYACTEETTTDISSVVYATKAAWTTYDSVGNAIYNAQIVDSTGEISMIKLQDSTAAGIISTAKFVKLTASTTVSGTYTATNVTNIDDLVVDQDGDQTITAATVKSNVGQYYFASDVKFIFYNATTQTTEVKTGLSSVLNVQLKSGDQLYFNDTVSANKTVSSVFVLGTYKTRLQNVAGTGVMFVPADATAKGTTASGALYDVYIDGVKTEAAFVFTTADGTMTDTDGSGSSGVDVRGQFIDYSVNSNGAYVLATDPTSVSSSVDASENLTVASGIYGTLITTTSLADYNAADAAIVDLRTTTTPISTLSGMASSGYTTLTLAVVFNSATKTVSTIYITAAA